MGDTGGAEWGKEPLVKGVILPHPAPRPWRLQTLGTLFLCECWSLKWRPDESEISVTYLLRDVKAFKKLF